MTWTSFARKSSLKCFATAKPQFHSFASRLIHISVSNSNDNHIDADGGGGNDGGYGGSNDGGCAPDAPLKSQVHRHAIIESALIPYLFKVDPQVLPFDKEALLSGLLAKCLTRTGIQQRL